MREICNVISTEMRAQQGLRRRSGCSGSNLTNLYTINRFCMVQPEFLISCLESPWITWYKFLFFRNPRCSNSCFIGLLCILHNKPQSFVLLSLHNRIGYFWDRNSWFSTALFALFYTTRVCEFYMKYTTPLGNLKNRWEVYGVYAFFIFYVAMETRLCQMRL